MRKNAITQVIPTYSFDDEKNATVSGITQENKDLDAPSPSTGQWFVLFLFSIRLGMEL